MGLFGDIVGTALGGPALGLPLAHFFGDLTGRPGPSAAPFQERNPVEASGIPLDQELRNQLGRIGSNQGNTVSNVYNRIRQRAATEARSPNVQPSDYLGERLNTGETLSQLSVKSGLENVLGNTAYGQYKSARDYNQNEALARYIGSLNKKSLLEEILGGLSGAAKPIGQFAGLYNSLGTRGNGVSGGPPEYGTASNPYGDVGSSLYNLGDYARYPIYPNELRRRY